MDRTDQTGRWSSSVAALKADTSFTLTAGSLDTVAVGDVIQTRIGGYAYEVVASDPDITTAGGIMLRVLPGGGGVVTPLAYGATGNGLIDDADALERTLRSGHIVFGGLGRIYACGRRITVTNVETQVTGLTILNTGAGGGVDVSLAVPKLTRWRDCKFLTNGLLSGTAFKVSLASGGIVAARRDGFFYFENLNAVGVDQFAHCWTVGFHFHNTNMAVMKDVRTHGRRDLSFANGASAFSWTDGTTGILVTTDDVAEADTATSIEFYNANVRAVERGIVFDGPVEGLRVIDSKVVAARTGIIADVTSDIAPTNTQPALWIQNCHVNASQFCITTTRMTEVLISGCELYRYAAVWGYNFYAISANTMSLSTIRDNKILCYHHLRDGSEAGLVSSPGTFDVLRSTHVRDNTIWRASTGFGFLTVASDNIMTDNMFIGVGSVKETGFGAYTFAGGATALGNRIHAAAGAQNSVAGVAVAVTASATVICTSNTVTVAPGERYRFDIEYQATKGATAGNINFQVAQSAGAGVIAFPLTTFILDRPAVPAGAGASDTASGYFSVNGGGAVALTLYAASAGSNAIISAILRIIRVE
ncbi:hypothetical protein [Paracoccus aestuariivivens]|uniref:hypothetical protein n=1 Tax=Paracoccus aestuariivivens TaxID=1820333 RepID=UPI001478FCE6|nr:hypothetical protein [Paracoccus aestuariivivens]